MMAGAKEAQQEPKLQFLPHRVMYRRGKLDYCSGTVQGSTNTIFKLFPDLSD